ncbi:hypothetical protein PR048_010195 [Dryococelus australis]|uniref:Uncharacterized protein n=1 Tax=Dryococelus australis TaxID=614101 RepID=A0ABQ9I218_9NEOP|nr:hypothetical protein PR048_010195 [Dryococelus australis]
MVLSKQITVIQIVAHFTHSISLFKLLKNFLKNHNMLDHRLIQDKPTRWNSTYLMLEHLIEQRHAITWLTPEKASTLS